MATVYLSRREENCCAFLRYPRSCLSWQAKENPPVFNADPEAEFSDRRKPVASPAVNPFLSGGAVVVRSRNRVITTGVSDELITRDGEVIASREVRQVVQVDPDEFVKVFREGVRAVYDLTGTGFRVWGVVLDHYHASAMREGYADCVTLFRQGHVVNGVPLPFTPRTYQIGMKELLQKRFLHPRTSEQFWVNPALIFKGDRIRFVNEFHSLLPKGRKQ